MTICFVKGRSRFVNLLEKATVIKISEYFSIQKFGIRLRPYNSQGKFTLHLPPVLGWSKVVFSKGPVNEIGRLGGNYREEEKKLRLFCLLFIAKSFHHSTISFSNHTMIFTVCCLAQGRSVFTSVNEIWNPLVRSFKWKLLSITCVISIGIVYHDVLSGPKCSVYE